MSKSCGASFDFEISLIVCCGGHWSFGWQNADETALRTFVGERHNAVLEGEQGVIAAHADVQASAEFRAALTNQDVACQDFFAAEFLDAEHFGLAVTTVSGRTYAFFVGHFNSPLSRV